MRAWLLAGLAVAGGLGVAAAQVGPTLQTPPAPVVEMATVPAWATETGDRVHLTEDDLRSATEARLLPEDARSVLRLPKALKHGEFVWNDEGVPQGTVRVHVDLRRQLVSVFRGQHEIGAAVSLYGVDGHETPVGQFPIMAKIEDHWSATYDAPMPYTLRLTDDGVAVHGSDVRRGRATHGCVGVPLEFARHLFEHAQVGDIVEVVFSAARQA
jgi:lipoprotein-anchoring transpeptidase ErfK/SrfK